MKLKRNAIANYMQSSAPVVNNAAANIDIYEPQTLHQPFQKRMPVTTFLRDTFFPGYQTFSTKHVLMDFVKNNQSVAPFIAEGSGSINIRRQGYKTKIYEAPYISLSAPYDVNLLQGRLPGESVFNSGLTPEERALRLMQQDYNELDDRITRKEEVMVAEVMQRGSTTVTGFVDDTATKVRTDTVDYDFDNLIDLSGGGQWNQNSSKKYNDLYEAVTLVRQGGYNPEIAILGEMATRNLLADEAFMNHYMDKRFAQFGSINPQLNLQNGNGYAYIGRLTELGLDLFSYIAWYFDEVDQKLKPYIKPNKVIVGTRNMGEMLYGAITMIPEGSNDFATYESPRVPKVTINRENDVKKLHLKSRPLPKPFDVSSWSVIDTVRE
ncbi:major capsid protein [Paenibacillus sp. GCM10012307]|uniref:Major capsid protein n=1 Tax=Paenibacillus roseus TaxID=2798579 RepID=A0A934J836_9BACL|nr:major capsid protein [Paenibacillus roseus]MBJ6362105.1 major capsid protein [Paenibacillus roseus]